MDPLSLVVGFVVGSIAGVLAFVAVLVVGDGPPEVAALEAVAKDAFITGTGALRLVDGRLERLDPSTYAVVVKGDR